jgi:hypothetical protein
VLELELELLVLEPELLLELELELFELLELLFTREAQSETMRSSSSGTASGSFCNCLSIST